MNSKITNGIRVSVKSRYEETHSDSRKRQYIFSYDVVIENFSDRVVKLLSRHWSIFDASGIRREVEGEGVIGQQPEIPPGGSHSYSSWCPLFSGMGMMSGTYTMLDKKDFSKFEVEVPEFNLEAPMVMN